MGIEQIRRHGWLTGTAFAVALAAAAVLLIGVAWAAAIDLRSSPDRNSAPLEFLSTAYKSLAFVGLWVIARRLHSTSVKLLALLMAALLAGGLALDIDAISSFVDRITLGISDLVPLTSGQSDKALIFGTLAVLVIWLVVAAYMKASPEERLLAVILIVLIGFVGVFAGPVNAISSFGINREWLFAEDFGQVVGLSLLCGYVAGVVFSLHGQDSGKIPVSPSPNVVDAHADGG